MFCSLPSKYVKGFGHIEVQWLFCLRTGREIPESVIGFDRKV